MEGIKDKVAELKKRLKEKLEQNDRLKSEAH